MDQITTQKVMRSGAGQEAEHRPRPPLWQMLRTAGVVYSLVPIQGIQMLLALACGST